MRPISTDLAFWNDTGELILPGAALEITGLLEEEGELIWRVKKPTASGIGKGIIIFNAFAEVADEAGGDIQHGPVIIARRAVASIALGDECGPVDDSYEISADGVGFTCLGSSSIFEQAVLIRPRTLLFDVRVKPDGSALQKSRDGGGNWTDWATIGTCS